MLNTNRGQVTDAALLALQNKRKPNDEIGVALSAKQQEKELSHKVNLALKHG
ncbi:31983_t:CDS:1, partial [Gigaspora margarita]